MEKLEINYSFKDIPVHSVQFYPIKIFEMTNRFLNKIRWAAFWYEKRNN